MIFILDANNELGSQDILIHHSSHRIRLIFVSFLLMPRTS